MSTCPLVPCTVWLLSKSGHTWPQLAHVDVIRIFPHLHPFRGLLRAVHAWTPARAPRGLYTLKNSLLRPFSIVRKIKLRLTTTHLNRDFMERSMFSLFTHPWPRKRIVFNIALQNAFENFRNRSESYTENLHARRQ